MIVTDHFSSEDWVDLVRGVSPAERCAEIERHVAGGCRDCADLHRLWRAVGAILRADEDLDPGESATDLARALYGVPGHTRPLPFLPEWVPVPAHVVFDSELLATPVGMRSGALGRRKILYASADLIIDVQVDTRPAGRTALVGQVTMFAAADGHAAGVPVLVVRGAEILARATTNRLGEFQTEFIGSVDDVSIALGPNGHGAILSLNPLRRVHS